MERPWKAPPEAERKVPPALLEWKAPQPFLSKGLPSSTMQGPSPPPTTQGLKMAELGGILVPPGLVIPEGANTHGKHNLRGHGGQRDEDGVHTTEKKTKEAADAQEFWKDPSPASSAKALPQSHGDGDKRKVTMYDRPDIVWMEAQNQVPSDEHLKFTASMSKELDQWLRYQALAVSDPTADSDPSEGSKGSEASEATVSNDSSKSSEISVVVEWPAVADRLVEAMITEDEAKKKEIEKQLQKRKERFLKERKKRPYIAWKNGEPQREASRNKTRKQKTAKVNEVAADYVLKEAVKSPRDEQHEAALEQMKAGCDKGGG